MNIQFKTSPSFINRLLTKGICNLATLHQHVNVIIDGIRTRTSRNSKIKWLIKGPVPLEPAITRDQFSRATRAGRGQSWIFPAI